MDEKKVTDLIASLMLEPGFVLVPQDRHEELLRAEAERDIVVGVVTDPAMQDYAVRPTLKSVLRRYIKAGTDDAQ